MGNLLDQGRNREHFKREEHPEDRTRIARGPATKKELGRLDGTRFVQRGTPGGKPSRISVQSTAPADPEVGDLWVDTT